MHSIPQDPYSAGWTALANAGFHPYYDVHVYRSAHTITLRHRTRLFRDVRDVPAQLSVFYALSLWNGAPTGGDDPDFSFRWLNQLVDLRADMLGPSKFPKEKRAALWARYLLSVLVDLHNYVPCTRHDYVGYMNPITQQVLYYLIPTGGLYRGGGDDWSSSSRDIIATKLAQAVDPHESDAFFDWGGAPNKYMTEPYTLPSWAEVKIDGPTLSIVERKS